MNAAEGGDCRLTQGLGRGLAGRGGGRGRGRRARGRGGVGNKTRRGRALPGRGPCVAGARGGGEGGQRPEEGARGGGRGPPRAGGSGGRKLRAAGGGARELAGPPPPPQGSAEKLGSPRPGAGPAPGGGGRGRAPPACLPAAFPGAGRPLRAVVGFPTQHSRAPSRLPAVELSPERTPGLAAAGRPRPAGERPCPLVRDPRPAAGWESRIPKNKRSGRTESRVNGIASDGQRGSAGGINLFTSPRRWLRPRRNDLAVRLWGSWLCLKPRINIAQREGIETYSFL